MAKFTSKMIDQIIASLDGVGGDDYLDELSLRDPPTYCRLLAHVLPKAVSIEAQIAEPIDLGRAMAEASARLAHGQS